MAGKDEAYSRKDKSLGLLCDNFLQLYGSGEQDTISLDEAAHRLKVERRRIYDIVNVLESVEVVVRQQKNRYKWQGMSSVPSALDRLRQGALQDDAFVQEAPSVGRVGDRKEKSLGRLSQMFIQMFLAADPPIVALDDAAKTLLGDSEDASKLKTKVRRLYDIANILTSLQLIKKTHLAKTRKPAFRWLNTEASLRLEQPSTAVAGLPSFDAIGSQAAGASSGKPVGRSRLAEPARRRAAAPASGPQARPHRSQPQNTHAPDLGPRRSTAARPSGANQSYSCHDALPDQLLLPGAHAQLIPSGSVQQQQQPPLEGIHPSLSQLFSCDLEQQQQPPQQQRMHLPLCELPPGGRQQAQQQAVSMLSMQFMAATAKAAGLSAFNPSWSRENTLTTPPQLAEPPALGSGALQPTPFSGSGSGSAAGSANGGSRADGYGSESRSKRALLPRADSLATAAAEHGPAAKRRQTVLGELASSHGYSGDHLSLQSEPGQRAGLSLSDLRSTAYCPADIAARIGHGSQPLGAYSGSSGLPADPQNGAAAVSQAGYGQDVFASSAPGIGNGHEQSMGEQGFGGQGFLGQQQLQGLYAALGMGSVAAVPSFLTSNPMQQQYWSDPTQSQTACHPNGFSSLPTGLLSSVGLAPALEYQPGQRQREAQHSVLSACGIGETTMPNAPSLVQGSSSSDMATGGSPPPPMPPSGAEDAFAQLLGFAHLYRHFNTSLGLPIASAGYAYGLGDRSSSVPGMYAGLDATLGLPAALELTTAAGGAPHGFAAGPMACSTTGQVPQNAGSGGRDVMHT